MNEKRVAFYTLGCKVSQYETEAIRESFLARGFTEVAFTAVSDCYVINTCTVTQESDAKSRKAIRRAIRQNPAACVMVAGCYSQAAPGEVAALSGVTHVFGNADKMQLAAYADRYLASESHPEKERPTLVIRDIQREPFEPMAITSAPRTRAYVKIEDGCECRCTYCAIPASRGSVRSKPVSDVVSEVKTLVAGGTREVVLTGIETASYGKDLAEQTSLMDLVERVAAGTAVERIRLGSLTPELLTEDFVRRAAACPKLTPHYHLSIQSGSNATLRRMRRRYNREMALRGIGLLRTHIADCMLTADVIVGFPGETEEEFAETLDFVQRAAFLQIHIFAYSRRAGTPAADMADQVPPDVKKSRESRLFAVAHTLANENLERTVAEKKPLPVLFETWKNGKARGHTPSYIEVEVASRHPLNGEVFSVRPQGYADGVLFGDLIN